MELLEVILLLIAGFAGGAVNAAVGGGSLMVFSALLGTGVPALVAKWTTTVAVFPGNVASVGGGYRDLPQGATLLRLLPATLLGAVVGSVLLLVTPARTFDLIVPFLVISAAVVLGLQDQLFRLVGRPGQLSRRHRALLLHAFVAAGGVYGGYIGAGFGIILVAGLSLIHDESLARIVALKNFLSSLISLVAVVLFVVFGQIDWASVAVLAPATIVGGYIGARFVQRLPSDVLKAAIVIFGAAFGLVLLARNVL